MTDAEAETDLLNPPNLEEKEINSLGFKTKAGFEYSWSLVDHLDNKLSKGWCCVRNEQGALITNHWDNIEYILVDRPIYLRTRREVE